MKREDVLDKAREISELFLGWDTFLVLGFCLSGLVVAAKKLGMTKLELQKMLIEHWDET